MAAEKPRRGVWRFLQAGTLVAVTGLLALLVWRVVTDDRSGAQVVAAVKSGEKPAAPDFDLPVIWDRTENWPPRLRLPRSRRGRSDLRRAQVREEVRDQLRLGPGRARLDSRSLRRDGVPR